MARIFFERSEPGDDPRHLAERLGADDLAGAISGECVPPVDVLETKTAVEIVMDLPGVAASSLKVIVARGTVVIAGQKLASGCEHREAAFQLAERAFGRFARAVELAGAFDAGRASATLAAGELRIVIPRLEERRGREIRIPITSS